MAPHKSEISLVPGNYLFEVRFCKKFLRLTLNKKATKGKRTGCGNFRWLMIYLPRAGNPRRGSNMDLLRRYVNWSLFAIKLI